MQQENTKFIISQTWTQKKHHKRKKIKQFEQLSHKVKFTQIIQRLKPATINFQSQYMIYINLIYKTKNQKNVYILAHFAYEIVQQEKNSLPYHLWPK